MLAKDTFKNIICLKSWGIIKEKDEEDIRDEAGITDQDLTLFII